MPRQSRIDAPGALHHIIARAIERQKLFESKADYDDFLNLCLSGKCGKKAAEIENIEPSEPRLPGKERKRMHAHSLFCYWAA